MKCSASTCCDGRGDGRALPPATVVLSSQRVFGPDEHQQRRQTRGHSVGGIRPARHSHVTRLAAGGLQPWCTTDRRQHRLPAVGPTTRSFRVTPRLWFVISVSTSTQTCQYAVMSGGLCRAVSLPSIRRQVQLLCSTH